MSGTPKFPIALFKAARDATRCEHLTAFAFSRTTTPRVLLAANTGNLPVASIVAEKYVQRYWMLDPASHIPPDQLTCDNDLAVTVRSEEIEDSGYRRDCYTNVGLQDRVSLIKRKNGEIFRINFYASAKSGRFASEEMTQIMESSDILMSLLAKHDAAATPPQRDAAAEVFARRLNLIAKKLPKREIEVCTLIASGVSSEGIALELGISLNTVLTHRKRAYFRLGISSQNELLRLLMS